MLRLLNAMGWETANIHLGSGRATTLRADLKKRPRGWLLDAARAVSNASPLRYLILPTACEKQIDSHTARGSRNQAAP